MLRRLGDVLQPLHRCYGIRRPPLASCAGAIWNVLKRYATTVAPTESISSPDVKQDLPAIASDPQETPITSFAYYWETLPPSTSQLRIAERFFTRSAPSLLYSTESFRQVQFSSMPEVAFLGRSNVGKSSLLNSLMGCEICHTSKKPGRTRSMNFFAVGGEDQKGNPGRLVLLDVPGYGFKSHAQWGNEILKYLVGRKQLKRVFLLIDPRHGFKPKDHELLTFLRENGISHQVVMSKVDRIITSGKGTLKKHQSNYNTQQLQRVFETFRQEIQPEGSEHPVALGELIACSAEKRVHGQRIGINNLRWAVLAAAGLNSTGSGLSSIKVGRRILSADDESEPEENSTTP